MRASSLLEARTRNSGNAVTTAIFLFFVTAHLLVPGSRAEDRQAPRPDDLLARIQHSIGSLSLRSGYRLAGRFSRIRPDGRTHYRATYFRNDSESAVTFLHDDPSLSLHHHSSADSWVSSPEVSTDVEPDDVPYTVRYDFPYLYHALVRILQDSSDEVIIEAEGNNFIVQGKLSTGEQATYLINSAQYLPLRVSIRFSEIAPPDWLVPTLQPRGTVEFLRSGTGPGKGIELWFSNYEPRGALLYPKRTDFLGADGVRATFRLENLISGLPEEEFLSRPPRLPWMRELDFVAGRGDRQSVLYKRTGRQAFDDGANHRPRKDWLRSNRWLAMWGSYALGLDDLVPRSWLVSTMATVVCFSLVFVVAWVRRGRETTTRLSPWQRRILQGSIPALLGAFLTVAYAIYRFDIPKHRDKLILQLAIRHDVSADQTYKEQVVRKLETLTADPPLATCWDLAHASQSYALAYHLMVPFLEKEEKERIEQQLFEFAQPLYGSLKGWRANTMEGTVLTAGLGMVGISIGYRPYVDLARLNLRKFLESKLVAKSYPAGPGPVSYAVDHLSNFMFALKCAEVEDYYRHPNFVAYVRDTLRLFSPVGTLPLFGGTHPEDMVSAIPLLLKTANHVPEALGRQSVRLHDRYWKYGQFRATGWRMRLMEAVQPHLFFLRNPYVLFHYQRPLLAKETASGSCIVGASAVVLRTGNGPDALYMALNGPATRPKSRDILTFDLYGFRGLLLHGPAAAGAPFERTGSHTADANTITLNGAGQNGNRGSGIGFSLLNQGVFDVVRLLAPRIYTAGKMQRDAILVRPDSSHNGYFVLIDEIHTDSGATEVKRYFHGRGDLSLGTDGTARWSSWPNLPPRVRTTPLVVRAMNLGRPLSTHSSAGMLADLPLLGQPSSSIVQSWNGSRRLSTLLLPDNPRQPEIEVERFGGTGGARVGRTDWIAVGDLGARRSIGPLRHISEYTIVREQSGSYPSVLMVRGLEFEFRKHSLASSKPVTLSLHDLEGQIITTQSNTRIELRSPAIDRYLLEPDNAASSKEGALTLVFDEPGTYHIRVDN